MCTGGGELITADEPAVVTKPLLDPIVVENDQGDGGLANSASADESDWDKVLSEIDYLFNQLVASKEGPWRQKRRFPRCASSKCKITGSFVVWVADLVRVYTRVVIR